jgi:hypothetical protein
MHTHLVVWPKTPPTKLAASFQYNRFLNSLPITSLHPSPIIILAMIQRLHVNEVEEMSDP